MVGVLHGVMVMPCIPSAHENPNDLRGHWRTIACVLAASMLRRALQSHGVEGPLTNPSWSLQPRKRAVYIAP